MTLNEGRRSIRVASRAGVLIALAVLATARLATPTSVAASAVCPPPGTLAEIISVDATHTGPLTEQFRPIYGVYAEGAASCWPGQTIELVGFVASPEGLGGARSWAIEPSWLAEPPHFLSVTATVDPDSGPVGPFLPVAVPPDLETTFERLEGHWVRATGQFDDPAAETCVVTMGDPALGTAPTSEQAVDICRTSFVVHAVEPLATPNTDVAAQIDAVATESRPIVPAVAGVAVLALALFLRMARRTGA